MARITREEIKAYQLILTTDFDTFLDTIIPALEEAVDRYTRQVLDPFPEGLKEIVSQMAKFKIDELTRAKNIKSENINGDYTVTYTDDTAKGSSGYPISIERALNKYRVLFDPKTSLHY